MTVKYTALWICEPQSLAGIFLFQAHTAMKTPEVY